MIARVIAPLFLIALIHGPLLSQDLNKPKLDSLFDVLAANDKAMGSIVLAKNGAVVYSKAVGYSFISETSKIPATDKTNYRIGSITKMFTATMIFQLVEEKKLTLATNLSAFYPTVRNSEKISIGHMLGHRSGLHSFTDDSTYMTWMTEPRTEKQMVELISKYPPDFEPDGKTAYSNSNFLLLGYILEKITMQSYSANLKNRITAKVGMPGTYYGGKGDPKKGEALSYRFLNGWQPAPETDMSIPGGAGALLSTPADLAKFIEALFAGKLVSDVSLKQMKTITGGMGMGMFQVPFHSKSGFGHNGMIDGSASNLFYFPDDGLALAYCSNGVMYGVNDIMIGVLSIYFNMPYTVPVFKSGPAISLTEGELDRYLGIYSSSQVPLKLTISRNSTQLMCQATGQSSFPVSPFDTHKFKFEPAGVVLEFNPEDGEVTLKQGGGSFTFKREK
jgi:D-alanyl-D-alanine carboxypeptidase